MSNSNVTKQIGIKLDGVYDYRDIGADIDNIDVYYKNGEIVPKDNPEGVDDPPTSALTVLQNKQDVIQFKTMPTTGKVGMIIQYIGTTNTTYQQGAFYISKSNGAGGLAWEKISSIALDNTTGGTATGTQVAASSKALYNTTQELRSAFQAGVDAVYQACITAGIQPTSSTPKDIASAIAIAANGTARAGNILKGKTALAGNAQITGTMVDYSTAPRTVSPSGGSGNQILPLSSGYHDAVIVDKTAVYNTGITEKRGVDRNLVDSANEYIVGKCNLILQRIESKLNQQWKRSDIDSVNANLNYIRNKMNELEGSI